MISGVPDLDWSKIDTALLLGVVAYVWKQARSVDQIRQALMGFGSQQGALSEIKMLRDRSHELANALQALQSSVELLTAELHSRKP